MALDQDTIDYIESRLERFENDVARGIAKGHKIHDARPLIERQGLEVQYGTVSDVNSTEVRVILDADPGTEVPMFTMVNVAPGQRVACALVPPSSGIVWGTLGGIQNAVVIQTASGQVAAALEIKDPDGLDLITVTPTGAIDMAEQTAPGAPGANTGRLFMVDNGAGKTRLSVIFPSGAAQTIATEP
jgi:hypothetical protein